LKVAGKARLLVDLTYGDAAKGATVDFLARTEPVHTVVRFNGGPQAGHNVVTHDGRHHTFSQFGSASFVPGVLTYLSRFVLVNPLNAFAEAVHLRTVGVPDAFERLVVHPDCLVITPYHVAANRLRELARGASRHGSCGMGIGETVADALAYPDEALRVRDLASPAITARKLAAARDRLRRALGDIVPPLGASGGSSDSQVQHELATFTDPQLIDHYVDCALAYSAQVTPADEGWLRARMRTGVSVFEPAQGTLIDEDYGFHPYTTWSHTTLANAEALLRETGFDGEVVRVGLVRAYSTRHGAGPFVPEDATMTACLPDPYNVAGAWQGAMRRGPFDFVATRYALAVNPGVDRLAISHLDYFGWQDHPDQPAGSGHRWPFCRRYAHAGTTEETLAIYDASGRIADLRPAPWPDLAYQERLTGLLGRCAPMVERVDAHEILDLVEQETGRPVGLCAWGPTAKDRISVLRPDRTSTAGVPAMALSRRDWCKREAARVA
jgi:adenylosuccinate synthase